MLKLLGVFLSTWVFSPVGGTAYAVAQGFSSIQTVALIAAMNAIIVVLWFGIVGFFARRLERVLMRRRTVHVPIVKRRKVGHLTIAEVGFIAFVAGSVWAVIITYMTNVNKLVAWAVITPCTVGSGLLWTLGSLGVIPFLPSPWWLYLMAVGATALSVGSRVYRNFDKIREVIRKIREKS